MELPVEIQKYIHEFAKPLTRPDWRKGGRFGSIEFQVGLKDQLNRVDRASSLYERAIGRGRMSRNASLVWNVRYMYV